MVRVMMVDARPLPTLVSTRSVSMRVGTLCKVRADWE